MPKKVKNPRPYGRGFKLGGLNEEFIKIANERINKRTNISFEKCFLRKKLSNQEKFDVVLFCSVLHEFFSYGEGISTVVKALSDAHEIMRVGGTLIIRDMILYDYTSNSQLWIEEMIGKVKTKKKITSLLGDFERFFGKIGSITCQRTGPATT